MQEVQDMLNRMVTLATQSANGTYDNETDRAALQQEVDQLNSEIDRIADSANFNGIKLLDGSLDANGRRAVTETVFANLTAGSNVNGTPQADGANQGFGGVNAKGSLKLTGSNLGAAKGLPDKSDQSVRYHEDAKESSKTTFDIELGNVNFDASTGAKLEDLIFGLASGTNPGTAVAGSTASNCLFAGATGADGIKYSVTAGNSGKITGEDIASAVMKAIGSEGKVYIEPAGGTKRIEYSVTQEGSKLSFTMTDQGYNDAVANQTADATKNYFQGNFNFGVNHKTNPTGTTAADELEKAFNKVVGEIQNTGTCNVNEGTSPADTIYAEALIRFSAAGDANSNKIADVIKDGAGFQIGDEYYVFAGSDEVYNGEYADNVHVVDIRDLSNIGKNDGTQADDLRKALDRLSVAAKDNEMFDVQVVKGGDALCLTERSTYTGDANLTMKDYGLENQIRTFDSASSKTEVLKEAGKALTLQIGDTSEDFNQLKVNIGDVHAAALGVSGLSIADQESAGAAINTIRSAINQVSSIRGTLGATQNRLEHTSNNLSVMTENIQDAESTIRDTDIAEEMMSYTKNNILVQSAQAMLAQANQIPQGVLQLLG